MKGELEKDIDVLLDGRQGEVKELSMIVGKVISEVKDSRLESPKIGMHASINSLVLNASQKVIVSP
jgi:hypothetical protein